MGWGWARTAARIEGQTYPDDCYWFVMVSVYLYLHLWTLHNLHPRRHNLGGIIGTGTWFCDSLCILTTRRLTCNRHWRAGLFLRTAETLAQGGPGGLFLGYTAFSTVCVSGAFVMQVPLFAASFLQTRCSHALTWRTCDIFVRIVYCCTKGTINTIVDRPVSGGHISLASRFVDPAMEFVRIDFFIFFSFFFPCFELIPLWLTLQAMGWNYWYFGAITLPGRCTHHNHKWSCLSWPS